MAYAPPQQSSGSGWTNLQDYLQLNQQGAQKLGQDMAGQVGQQGQQAQGELQGAADQFTRGTMQGGQRYSGPQDLTQQAGFGQVAGDVLGAGAQANMLGSESGRGQLMAGQYGRQDYGQGQQGLDSFLSGAGAGNANRYQDVQNQYGHLGQELGQDVSNSAAQGAWAAQRPPSPRQLGPPQQGPPPAPNPTPQPWQKPDDWNQIQQMSGGGNERTTGKGQGAGRGANRTRGNSFDGWSG